MPRYAFIFFTPGIIYYWRADARQRASRRIFIFISLRSMSEFHSAMFSGAIDLRCQRYIYDAMLRLRAPRAATRRARHEYRWRRGLIFLIGGYLSPRCHLKYAAQRRRHALSELLANDGRGVDDAAAPSLRAYGMTMHIGVPMMARGARAQSRFK